MVKLVNSAKRAFNGQGRLQKNQPAAGTGVSTAGRQKKVNGAMLLRMFNMNTMGARAFGL